jgi:ABC-type polysaccharide/polyol phosphate transport system ATPase subunit
VVPVLEDINLTVKKGELVGILGRVGAGKVLAHLPYLTLSDGIID